MPRHLWGDNTNLKQTFDCSKIINTNGEVGNTILCAQSKDWNIPKITNNSTNNVRTEFFGSTWAPERCQVSRLTGAVAADVEWWINNDLIGFWRINHWNMRLSSEGFLGQIAKWRVWSNKLFLGDVWLVAPSHPRELTSSPAERKTRMIHDPNSASIHRIHWKILWNELI